VVSAEDDGDDEHHRVARQGARIELGKGRKPIAGTRIFGIHKADGLCWDIDVSRRFSNLRSKTRGKR